MPVSEVKPGQFWRSNDTGENWLVTKTYSEVFTSYAVLRKVRGIETDLLRVKVERSEEGATLPGFTFSQESEVF